MPPVTHNYGLTWIDQEELYECIASRFSIVLGLRRQANVLPPDPFTIVSQTMITNASLPASLAFESQRQINKTISNAVGAMHQAILGLAPNWESLGVAGGLLDVRTVHGYKHPRFNRPIVAEVKNRFNTIKASDEPSEWDKIKSATKME